MDVAAVKTQIGTTVPVRSAVPAETAQPPAARKPDATDVTLEQDKDSGQVIVSIVDAVTKEVLVQVPPASVRATVAGLLEMVRERQERR